ncbi:YoaK family protein [Roseateles sp. So40a]|uniref:YoaK family protein n=1 Tax=Roseateles sp. So40a TaxID=3400226 RepID=UPI003A83730B
MTGAKRLLVASLALGFIGGYVDTVGFVALFGLFTAHVTGNFVLIGAELSRSSGASVLLKLLVFPTFVLAVAAARMVALRCERTKTVASRPLLLMQAVLLVVALVCSVPAGVALAPDAPWAMATGLFMTAAMGVQNAAGRLAWPALTPTTVMTGNVTQVVIDGVDLLRGAAGPEVRERLGRFIWPVAAFAIGALSGAFAFVAWKFLALLLPLVMLAGLVVMDVRADHKA